MELFLDIDADKIPKRHRRDILVCIMNLFEKREIDNSTIHLLCLYMDTYWTCQGQDEVSDTYD